MCKIAHDGGTTCNSAHLIIHSVHHDVLHHITGWMRFPYCISSKDFDYRNLTTQISKVQDKPGEMRLYLPVIDSLNAQRTLSLCESGSRNCSVKEL